MKLFLVAIVTILVSFSEATPLGPYDGTSSLGKALVGSSSGAASSGGQNYVDRGTYRVYGGPRTPLIIKFDLVGAAYDVPASTSPGNPGRSRIIQADLVGLCLDYPRCTN